MANCHYGKCQRSEIFGVGELGSPLPHNPTPSLGIPPGLPAFLGVSAFWCACAHVHEACTYVIIRYTNNGQCTPQSDDIQDHEAYARQRVGLGQAVEAGEVMGHVLRRPGVVQLLAGGPQQRAQHVQAVRRGPRRGGVGVRDVEQQALDDPGAAPAPTT